MRILCVFGQYNYGRPSRGEGYEFSNFLPTLRRLGHDVLFLDSRNRDQYHSFAELNETLLRTVEEQRPHVIFTVLTHYEIWIETWEILRDAGIAATVNWATDDDWKYAQFSRFLAPAFHAFTTSYPSAYVRYQRHGISRVLLTQWAANSASLQPPLPASRCQYGVSFVGSAYGTRRRQIEQLRERGIDVSCFGYGWESGPIPAKDVPRIFRNSTISLNFTTSPLVWGTALPHRTNQVKARTFEVPGAGGFLVTEWAEGLERYYTPDREIVIFKDLDDLVDKVRYYLTHPDERDTIAQAGYQRTCAEHTYDRRLSDMLDFALRARDEYFQSSGITPTGRIDWPNFERAVLGHRPNRALLTLKKGLVAMCSAIWGPQRGPRAARRLLFELSWRIAGSWAYSAAGWPGRLFYTES